MIVATRVHFGADDAISIQRADCSTGPFTSVRLGSQAEGVSILCVDDKALRNLFEALGDYLLAPYGQKSAA